MFLQESVKPRPQGGILLIILVFNPVGKIAKKTVRRSAFFVNSVILSCHIVKNTLIQTQKYTHTDCFFGDFAHWARSKSGPRILISFSRKNKTKYELNCVDVYTQVFYNAHS